MTCNNPGHSISYTLWTLRRLKIGPTKIRLLHVWGRAPRWHEHCLGRLTQETSESERSNPSQVMVKQQ